MSAQHCPTRLITDAPAEIDAFGGHENVARSIVETVLTEKGGQTIGLEGNWGSGKSTIIKLASKMFSENNDQDITVAVFDAWAHQGDPLRRTFLENLIRHLQKVKWINKKYWDQKIFELAQRKREENHQHIPQLTCFGIIFALSLFGVPIGSAFISAKYIKFGIAISLAPIFVLIIGYIIGKAQRNKGTLSDLPALITGQSKTKIMTTVTQTPDPTSVEFESEFRLLLDEALELKNRKLILVVDNLDRVEPSDALSIWSTLQTFLGHSDHKTTKWCDRLWVLITYDKEGILRLWENQTDEDETMFSRRSPLACSFLDKTFQVRFRVPPLLLSKWREFLEEMLHQAFPKHQESDFHGVYRAFASKGQLEEIAPTPRKLKLFVNQIGALHRERQDEFPLSYLGCYVLLQEDGIDIRNVLLSKNSNPKFLEQIIGKSWREIIASLHFGVSIPEATQLLLREPIQTALANGDGNTLSELKSNYPTGFWSVIEDVVPAGQANWNDLNPSELANAAIALNESGLFVDDAQKDQPEARTICFYIQSAVKQVKAWNPFDTNVAQGMVAICQLLGGSKEIVLDMINGALKAAITTKEKSEIKIDKVTANEWLHSFLILIKGFHEQGLDDHITGSLLVPLDSEQWINAITDIPDENYWLLSYLELVKITEIDQVLSQRIVPDQLNKDIVRIVQGTLATQSRNRVKKMIQVVLTQFQSTIAFQGDKLAYLIQILRLCKSVGVIDSKIYHGLAVYYLHHLHQAFSQKHAEAAAACIYGFLESVPDQSKPKKSIGNSEIGYQNLTVLLQGQEEIKSLDKHFIEIVSKEQDLSLLLRMANAKQPVPTLSKKALKALLDSSEVPKHPEMIKEYWLLIRDVLNEDNPEGFIDFLKHCPELDKLIEIIFEKGFNTDDSSFYIALMEIDTEKKIVNWCIENLSSIDRDTWAKGLEKQSDLIELLLSLKEHGGNVYLGAPYLDALVKYAKGVALGQNQVLSHSTWKEVFGLLDEQQQVLFSRRAYEMLEEAGEKTHKEFFDLFTGALPEAKQLINERRFVDKVCRPIINTNNTSGLKWLANMLETYPSLFKKHKDQAAVKDFYDRIRHSLKNTDKESSAFEPIKRISQVCGIKIEDNIHG